MAKKMSSGNDLFLISLVRWLSLKGIESYPPVAQELPLDASFSDENLTVTRSVSRHAVNTRYGVMT